MIKDPAYRILHAIFKKMFYLKNWIDKEKIYVKNLC